MQDTKGIHVKQIACFADLRPYGIDCLTGEACGLGYRILCDVTEKGRLIIAKALGLPRNVQLAESWNSGTKEDPHVGCIMLADGMLVPIAVFALLESGCREARIYEDGVVVGLELDDTDEWMETRERFMRRRLRRLRYDGAAGDRNVHQMSGRVT